MSTAKPQHIQNTAKPQHIKKKREDLKEGTELDTPLSASVFSLLHDEQAEFGLFSFNYPTRRQRGDSEYVLSCTNDFFLLNS